MPFLAAIPAILGAVGAIGGGVGAIESGKGTQKASDAQSQLIQQETQQNQGEYDKMMQLFGQLQPFFQQYMSKGSPILTNVESGAEENIAHQYDNAAAQTNERLNASGYGSTPSGATAGAVGDLNAERAATSSSTFLQDLLANEAVKFQAAQGLQQMAGSLKPNQQAPASPTPSTLPNAINQIGGGVEQLAQNLPGKSPNYNNMGGKIPLTPPSPGINTPLSPLPQPVSDAGGMNSNSNDNSIGMFTPPGVMGFEGGVSA